MNAVVALAALGQDVHLLYVPGGSDPLDYYGLVCPPGLRLSELSRSLPWALHGTHSNRLFFWRLRRSVDLNEAVVLCRHLKLSSLLVTQRERAQIGRAHV